MTIWTGFERAGEWRVVPERTFFLPGFAFGPVWLLVRGAYAMAFATGALDLLLVTTGAAGAPLRFGIAAGIGLFASELERLELRLGGFSARATVVAGDRHGALLRLHERGF